MSALTASEPVPTLVEVLRERRGQVEAFCACFESDPHDREELVQLVLIRVWRGHGRFDGRSAFSTWLYQVVRNTAATEYGRRAARPVPVDVSTATGPAVVDGPEDAVVERDALDRAMRGVPSPFRDTVEMVDRWGCRPAEIASAVGVSEGTVRTRLHRGRRSLRSALGEPCR